MQTPAVNNDLYRRLGHAWWDDDVGEFSSHVWERFIKPGELCQVLARYGLEQRDLRGVAATCDPLAAWLTFRRRAKGQFSFREPGQRLAFCEGDDLDVSYMGDAEHRVAS